MSSSIPQLRNKEFTPNLPKIEERQLNGMGKIIRWIRNSRKEDLIQRTTVLCLTIFATFVFLASIVLSPIVIWGFVELTRQIEEIRLRDFKRTVLRAGIEHSEFHFNSGRLEPLANAKLLINTSTRKRMIHDLEIDAATTKNLSDRQLVQMASLKYENYLERYHLTISSTPSFFEYFSLNHWVS